MKPMDSLGPDFLSAAMQALIEGKPKCKHEAQRLQLSQSAACRSFWGGGGVGIKIAFLVHCMMLFRVMEDCTGGLRPMLLHGIWALAYSRVICLEQYPEPLTRKPLLIASVPRVIQNVWKFRASAPCALRGCLAANAASQTRGKLRSLQTECPVI